MYGRNLSLYLPVHSCCVGRMPWRIESGRSEEHSDHFDQGRYLGILAATLMETAHCHRPRRMTITWERQSTRCT